jgi:polyisoprenoid-binding protein YceI
LTILLLCLAANGAVLGVSPGSGRLGFELQTSVKPVSGEALGFSGSIDTDALTGTLSVDATALTTGFGPRDSRMLTTCLEVARFPAIQLVVASIEGDIAGLRHGAGTGAVTLAGTLTIRDVVRPVSVPATYAWEGDDLRIKGRQALAWADFGVPDPSTLLAQVRPEVTILFDLVARPS